LQKYFYFDEDLIFSLFIRAENFNNQKSTE